jgi:Transposase DDE domain
MFLPATIRWEDGKEHRCWSVVESRRVAGKRVVQRPLLYLGEINDSQRAAWRKSIAVLEEGSSQPRTLSLFPDDRAEGLLPDASIVRLRLSELMLRSPRQWGACWPALHLWEELQLDRFWLPRLPANCKGTRWDQVLFILTGYRLIAPGSELRLYRRWFGGTALGDLLGGNADLSEIHKLYACHDRLLAHKDALFQHLRQRWHDLFNVSFDVLLYDLTSTYFEASPPFPEGDKRRFGYSRDHRPDCVQVVSALVVTPDGLPIAYEVLAGNTNDSRTLRDFLARIERLYGKARRIWLMDCGIPTEAVLAEMRASNPTVQYLVGTPKGRLTRLQKRLVVLPWQQARLGVQVKLLSEDDELYVFAESWDRVAKERAMRQRQLKWFWARLKQLAEMDLGREELLMRLGAARSRAPSAWRLVVVEVAAEGANFTFRLDRAKLRRARLREGRYLLRTNLPKDDPAKLWDYYIRLVEVEQAFKTLKGDLAIRPIFHQKEARVEAHILIAFLAFSLHATLRQRLLAFAPRLTPREVLDDFAAVQMIDVHVPTTDGRELTLTRYTEPEPALRLLPGTLNLQLPAQPPPRITASQTPPTTM